MGPHIPSSSLSHSFPQLLGVLAADSSQLIQGHISSSVPASDDWLMRKYEDQALSSLASRVSRPLEWT